MPSPSWAGTSSIKGSDEWVRMALLTMSLIGIQYVFSHGYAFLSVEQLKLSTEKLPELQLPIASPKT